MREFLRGRRQQLPHRDLRPEHRQGARPPRRTGLCAGLELEPRPGVGAVRLHAQRHQQRRAALHRRRAPLREVLHRQYPRGWPDGLRLLPAQGRGAHRQHRGRPARPAACWSWPMSSAARRGKPTAPAAMRLLRALNDLCADWSEEAPGILQKCTASYHDDGAGASRQYPVWRLFLRGSPLQAARHRRAAVDGQSVRRYVQHQH